ncbi:MAG: deoxyribonuclease [Thermoproteota archaeon]|nr:deoxyribonuclease [Thermoproteota archaeon]
MDSRGIIFLEERIDVLRKIQIALSLEIVNEDLFKKPLTKISGVDLAFTRQEAIIASVIVSYPSLDDLEVKTLVTELNFPYVPTLLCFREGPAIVKMINSLRSKVDVFMINSHGIAHPFICGCASYVGVLTQKPTIGVASSNLCSKYDYKPQEEGKALPVYYEGRTVGWILKSKAKSRPIFVSPGHLVGLDSSLRITKECLRDHKLPEPLFRAHRLANEEKNRIL